MSDIKASVVYVLGYAFFGNKVLLINKARPDWMKGKWNGLGGHVELEKNEYPIDAMVREFEEECDVQTYRKDWDPFCEVMVTRKDNSQSKVICFRHNAPRCYPTAHLITDEPAKWHDVPNIYKLPLVAGVIWQVPMALDRTVVNGVVSVEYLW